MTFKFSKFTYLVIIVILILIILLTFHYRSQMKNMLKKALPVVVLKDAPSNTGINIIFLHHSTGAAIWNGGVSEWFKNLKEKNNKDYNIVEQWFPVSGGNYPYDYWNIWVKNAGEKAYNDNPTLEMIVKNFDVVIWKQCYPVSNIEEDLYQADIKSREKRVENYKLQYQALKDKMLEFPNIKFIVWTGAALVKDNTTQEKAVRSKEFFEWVRNEWDTPGDNIFLWDFYQLETEGDLYLQNKYAVETQDSHPNEYFSRYAAPLFCQRIVDVIEDRGDKSDITGK